MTPKKTCVICPIGHFSDELLTALTEEIPCHFGLTAAIDTSVDDIQFAFNDVRQQYHSTSIIQRLASDFQSKATRVIALVDVDLFIPILTHVFGEAQLDGIACVVSSHRLFDGLMGLDRDKQFQRRFIKEAVHELGHTFGLIHCKDKACVMHYCRTIKDIDIKANRFCRYCSVLLEDKKGGIT